MISTPIGISSRLSSSPVPTNCGRRNGMMPNLLGVRVVDVFLHGLFDLRRHIRRVARIPTASPPTITFVASLVSNMTVLLRVSKVSCPLMASILHFRPRHSATVSRSQSINRRPSLAIVKATSRGSRLPWTERVNCSRTPHRGLPVGEMLQLPVLEIVGCKLAHLLQESQVTALGFHRRVGPLKDFDDALGLAANPHRSQHEQVIGRVGALIGAARMRRNQLPPHPAEYALHQPAMIDQVFLLVRHPRFAEVDLILKFQPATLARRPDRTAHGGERRDDAIQEFAEEDFRRGILLAEADNLVDETANLLLSLFDQTWVNRLFRAHWTHRSAYL